MLTSLMLLGIDGIAVRPLAIGLIVFLLACALVRVMPATWIPEGWKPPLYVVFLIVLVLYLAAHL
jgi:hypothetical protein